MGKFLLRDTDPIKKWLSSVAYSHSGSKTTEIGYKNHFQRFLKFIGKTAKQIMSEYQALKDFDEVQRQLC